MATVIQTTVPVTKIYAKFQPLVGQQLIVYLCNSIKQGKFGEDLSGCWSNRRCDQ